MSCFPTDDRVCNFVSADYGTANTADTRISNVTTLGVVYNQNGVNTNPLHLFYNQRCLPFVLGQTDRIDEKHYNQYSSQKAIIVTSANSSKLVVFRMHATQ